MLPIYKAMAIDESVIQSGSTKPCLMMVTDTTGDIIGQYVVKLFNRKHIEQNQSTNKEVYGHVLASAFDLSVPSAALIKVSSDIIDILNQQRGYRDFDLLPGYYFGTAYISNVTDYIPNTSLKVEKWLMETVFVFDVFIRNVDRRRGKPNLFIKKDELYLIDHELSLNTNNLTFDELFNEWEKYWKFIRLGGTRSHLFYEHLKSRNAKQKINFDEFMEYLRFFDTDLLNPYAAQLKSLGIDTEDFEPIKVYLEGVKSNPDHFNRLLHYLLD
ncbi:MAG: HipA family kinase [Bacteroidota bacterium]